MTPIGQGDGGHSVFHGFVDQLLDPGRAVKQGILAVAMEMNEFLLSQFSAPDVVGVVLGGCRRTKRKSARPPYSLDRFYQMRRL
jgi:hypothetical protein